MTSRHEPTTATQGEAAREPSGRVVRLPFNALVIAGVVLAATVTMLPALVPAAMSLVVATLATLLLPGAVILRLLGWPRSIAVAAVASATWSVAALAPGLVLVFVLEWGFSVAVVWLLAVTLVGLVVGWRRPAEIDVVGPRSIAMLCALTVGFMVMLYLGAHNNVGDAIEHIARMRKLTELNPPRDLADINLLPPSGGLHAGYAFPLWHAVIGIVVWIGRLEETQVFRYLPTLLFPFVAAAWYRAARTMFGCRAAGAAAVLALLAAFSFPDAGVGRMNKASYPGNVSIFLLWPIIVERCFAYLQRGGREPVLTVAAASFVVAAIHPSYSPLMMLMVGAFLLVRIAVVRDREEAIRLGVMTAAVTLPFLALLVWLYPLAASGGARGTAAQTHFASMLDNYGTTLRLKPGWATRGGAAQIAALLGAPFVVLAARTRAAAFVASGTVGVLLILLVPWFFTPFASVMTISQGRRLLYYLPWVFALVGASLVAARFRHWAVIGAGVLGVVLAFLWPGDFSYSLRTPGPGWVAWVSIVGIIVALVVGTRRTSTLRFGNRWAVPVMIAFVLPTAVTGVRLLDTDLPRADGMSEEMIAAVNREVARDDIVLAVPSVAYRLTARAPVYIVAAEWGHGGETTRNQHVLRREDAELFFSQESTDGQREQILSRWDVDWVLVRNDEPYPRSMLQQQRIGYKNKRYTLYEVAQAGS